MAVLSRRDLEGIAERVLERYRRLPQLAGQAVERVDPVLLAQEVCGLRMEHHRLSRDGATLGMTAFRAFDVEVYDDALRPLCCYLDGRTILIEKSLTEDGAQSGRYHFTVAHETAHQILAALFPSDRAGRMRIVTYRGDRPRYPIRDWEEWQADNLASCLLMPRPVLKAALRRSGLENGMDILNRVFRPVEYQQFCEAANCLQVSKQALSIRMMRLGLLEKEYLKNPYRLADIEMEEDEPWLKQSEYP